jgi:hypothetical protein
MFSLPTDGTNLTQVSTDTDATAAVTLFWTASAAGETRTLSNISIKEFTGVTNMPSAYAKNVGGLFPARFDYDPVTLAPRGLLIEEARTNLVTYSAEFDNAAWTKSNTTVTANATASPDGTVNADKLVEDTTTGTHSTTSPTVALTSGVAYTTTVYVKAAERSWIALQYDSGAFGTSPTAYFNLGTGTVGSAFNGAIHTIRNAGNGWYRCSITATATVSTNSTARIYLATGDNAASYTGVTGNGAFLYGAQFEAGAFATSYIPTVASTVTRTADIAAVTAANFSSWYNQPQGTFVVDVSTFKPTTSVTTANAVLASDGTGNNRAGLRYLTANVEELVITGGATQAQIGQAYTVSSIDRLAGAMKTNDFAFARNGALVGTDTSGTVPTVNRLGIGSDHSGSNQLFGHIRSIRYYPARLNNAQLQTLTA